MTLTGQKKRKKAKSPDGVGGEANLEGLVGRASPHWGLV